MKRREGRAPDGLTGWILRRLLLSLIVVFGAATVTFATLQLTPGDPTYAVLNNPSPPPELVAHVRHDLGFDRPVADQYARFLGRLATGDLGRSYQLDQPVWRVITTQLGSTVELAVAGFVLALGTAIVLATATAGRRPLVGRVSAALELLSVSTPSFWTGIVLLTFLSFRLHLFPATDGTGPRGLALPAVTLALGIAGAYTQVLREGLERALDEPFTLSSRARGSGETAVRLRHALRHALTPIVTMSGWTMGTLLTGAVIVESVFSRQGLGRTLATAISGHDLPLVTGIVVLAAAAFTVLNIAVDLLYRILDPRLREAAP
ncbi:ABC transporter permease [Actinomadura decatromicini]|uniref:ABC transporter permease n=1 Tax=Actinomadura decatromicini TaxID=2604572 RepID=UPI001CA3114E|nr:ABC transporter permease [Actinomadura decatromicini]